MTPPWQRIQSAYARHRSIYGSTYVIRARDGAELKVALADKAQIATVVKASLADVKQGLFVGVTAMPLADGGLSALEVRIFPDAMRGTGEGHDSWDLRPKSTMTNANIDQVVTAVDGQTLTLKYKDGEEKIFVPAERRLLLTCGATIPILKPGAKVLHCRGQQPDGTLQGRAWRVGRDGVTPLMRSKARRLFMGNPRLAVGPLSRSLWLAVLWQGAAVSGNARPWTIGDLRVSRDPSGVRDPKGNDGRLAGAREHGRQR